MKLVIGLDVGTTAAKAALFTAEGEQVALGERAYAVSYPRPGWAEQNADELWQGVVAAIRQLAARMPAGGEVVGLAVSAQGATTILLDRNLHPVRPAVSWMDQRAAGMMPDLASSLDAEKVYYAAGWPLSAWLPLVIVTWLRRHEPAIFERVRRLCFVDDWIKHRLCGEFAADPSSASITGLFDVKENIWQPEFLRFIDFDASQLSPVAPHAQPIARLTRQAAEALGLPRTTWVINGAHDQICCLTAVGVVRPGQVMLGTGAAWVVAGVADRPLYDLARGMCVEPHSIPGLWSPLRSQGGVGACVEWLVTTQLAGLRPGGSREELYASLDRQVIASPLGANGLLFMPPRGRRNQGADGGMLGLSLSHTPGDLGRALMEGVAYDLRVYLAEMRAAGLEMDTLIMTGGATRSPLWPAIVADVLGMPVHIPQVGQAGVRGAAILAAVGAGLYPDVPSALEAFHVPSSELLPNREHHQAYEELFARFQDFDRAVAEGLAIEESGAASSPSSLVPDSPIPDSLIA